MFTLVTLPIGNIGDLTLRAKKILEESEICLVEDTRSFRDFCKFAGINLTEKRVYSWHDHTEIKHIEKVIDFLEQKKKVIFASEAGSPIISDPAYPVVRALLEKGYDVDTAPGVSAPIAALELSGFPPIPFHFHGFPPRDQGKRESYLLETLDVYGTHILFEGVTRVQDTIDELVKLHPDLEIVVAREITKVYQSIYRFSSATWPKMRGEIMYKGEFVILYHASGENKGTGSRKLKELAQEVLDSKARVKDVSKLLAAVLGKSSKEIYEELK